MDGFLSFRIRLAPWIGALRPHNDILYKLLQTDEHVDLAFFPYLWLVYPLFILPWRLDGFSIVFYLLGRVRCAGVPDSGSLVSISGTKTLKLLRGPP